MDDSFYLLATANLLLFSFGCWLSNAKNKWFWLDILSICMAGSERGRKKNLQPVISGLKSFWDKQAILHQTAPLIFLQFSFLLRFLDLNVFSEKRFLRMGEGFRMPLKSLAVLHLNETNRHNVLYYVTQTFRIQECDQSWFWFISGFFDQQVLSRDQNYSFTQTLAYK